MRWRTAEASHSNHGTWPELKTEKHYLLRALTIIDPIADDVVTIPSRRYSGRHAAIAISRTYRHDDNHYWFRSVYRVMNLPHMGYSVCDDYADLARVYAEKLNQAMSKPTPNLTGVLRDIGSQQGVIYFVIEGGASFDSAGVNPTVNRDITQLSNANWNLSMLNRTESHVSLTRGCSCCYVSVEELETGPVRRTGFRSRYNLEGVLLSMPFGTRGYVRASVQIGRDMRSPPAASFSDEEDLINRVRSVEPTAYPIYTGWIPEDLTDVTVDDPAFQLVKVGDNPLSLYSSDIIDRLHGRRLHFRGSASLLINGVKYPVTAGEYFMIPKSAGLEEMNMLQYDLAVVETLSQMTMLAHSSRSQAITNRTGDVSASPVKTSIKSRGLSHNREGDSGFIARPKHRRIN